MQCGDARRAVTAKMEAGPLDGPLAEHLESCPGCAAEVEEHRAVWLSLEGYEAPLLGEAAGLRIRRELCSALEDRSGASWWRRSSSTTPDRPAWSPRSFAVVGAAVLLGLGTGGWLGLGARQMLGAEPPRHELPATHAGLLDVADLVFDIAPPGSPASAWFVDSQGGGG